MSVYHAPCLGGFPKYVLAGVLPDSLENLGNLAGFGGFGFWRKFAILDFGGPPAKNIGVGKPTKNMEPCLVEGVMYSEILPF